MYLIFDRMCPSWRLGITENEAGGAPMYFERWDLLAPPSGKADVLEGYVVSALSLLGYYTSSMVGVQSGRTGVLACKKLPSVLCAYRREQVMCLLLNKVSEFWCLLESLKG